MTNAPHTNPTSGIRVAVVGACGRMGSATIQMIVKDPALNLVAAVDRVHVGEDAGAVSGGAPIGLPVTSSLTEAIESTQPEVVVDFTVLNAAVEHVHLCLERRVVPVVGTSGFAESTLEGIRAACDTTGTPCLVIPNFAIGAVLMMMFAAEAARYLPHCEIIEMHHDRKKDAPSGTAIRTAEMISRARRETPALIPQEEKYAGSRGATVNGIPVHAIRLSGYVASQEVLFGGEGERLSIRHDSTDRSSFMPGVNLAIKRARSCQGLVVGLEHLLR